MGGVFPIETAAVLDTWSEQMTAAVTFLTKVTFPFKGRHQRMFPPPEEITSGRVDFVQPFLIFVFDDC